ncbi:MAG: non-homologous end-joining DNA ligase [Candidatus Eremiobacteraeota bacterium]|nr:non-homologous end-joining DNA ligase [Candidatus Eremiobacteraeota bacterium]MBV8365502.1 non-homologous end-joining DNA ligase [Candidatus Eremiobacteraeota bacterium]
MRAKGSLREYKRKRDFTQTSEPAGALAGRAPARPRFVVQKHRASHLHYDFRLEAGGVLKSWAVPKGPSLNPADKRLAMHVEDHPLDYYDFEGVIPEGNYGAGQVIVWDYGWYELAEGSDPAREIAHGKIKFILHGRKLRGLFTLVKMRGKNSENNAWLLFKDKDEYSDPRWDAEEHARSAKSGKTLDDVAGNPRSRTWISNRAAAKRAPSRAGSARRGRAASARTGAARGDGVPQFTNLDKVLWPQDGYTKGDLIKYYLDVARWLLPYLQDRPLTLQRFPNGIEGQSFFEKQAPRGAPEWVRTESVPSEYGKRSRIDYVVCDDERTLAWLSNLGAITLHAWISRVGSLDSPDFCLLDMDPQAGCTLATLAAVTLRLRDELEALGISPAVKTSGGKGLHVMWRLAPGYDYEEVRRFTELTAQHLANVMSDRVTLERSIKKRKRGSVYIDWAQIGKGKTIVMPFTVRPRAKAPVSWPLAWSEVERMARSKAPDIFKEAARWNIANVPALLKKSGDPWKKALSKAQRFEPALKKAQARWAARTG